MQIRKTLVNTELSNIWNTAKDTLISFDKLSWAVLYLIKEYGAFKFDSMLDQDYYITPDTFNTWQFDVSPTVKFYESMENIHVKLFATQIGFSNPDELSIEVYVPIKWFTMCEEEIRIDIEEKNYPVYNRISKHVLSHNDCFDITHNFQRNW